MPSLDEVSCEEALNQILETHKSQIQELFRSLVSNDSSQLHQNDGIIDPVVPDEMKYSATDLVRCSYHDYNVTKTLSMVPFQPDPESNEHHVDTESDEVRRPSDETDIVYHHSLSSELFRNLKLQKTRSFFIPSWKTAQKTRWQEFQSSVWNFLEQPDGGISNQIFHSVTNLLIAISVTNSVMETALISDNIKEILHLADTCFTCLFTIELLVKIVCYPERGAFLRSFYTLIDFAVVFAGLLGIFLEGVQSIWLDLISTQVPILRLLKITRHSSGWRLLMLAMKKSVVPLLVPLYLMLLMIVFTGSLHFWIDNVLACRTTDCTDDEKPAFVSIPHAMWFVLVSLSTVGYGDITPHTDVGKSLACCQIVMGLCYMAMPLAIIGNSFSEVWNDRHRILLSDKLSRGSIKRDIKDVRRLFYTFDDDKSGEISLDEFVPFVESLEMGLSKRVIHDLFRSIDLDGSGIINFDEFAEFVFPESMGEECAEECAEE